MAFRGLHHGGIAVNPHDFAPNHTGAVFGMDVYQYQKTYSTLSSRTERPEFLHMFLNCLKGESSIEERAATLVQRAEVPVLPQRPHKEGAKRKFREIYGKNPLMVFSEPVPLLENA
jgi:hypothetical protein